MTSHADYQAPKRESLRRLLKAALDAFPDPDDARRIRLYITELSHVMQIEETGDAELDADMARAKATCEATSDDAVTLLYKLEDYLESVLIGRLAASGWSSRGEP